MSRETDLAWAAGLFEGEGTVGASIVRHRGKAVGAPYPKAKLAMTDPEPVYRFAAILGLGSLCWENRKPPHNDILFWSDSGTSNVETVLALLGDHLSERRLAQFKSAPADATPSGLDWHQKREHARQWRAREGVV